MAKKKSNDEIPNDDAEIELQLDPVASESAEEEVKVEAAEDEKVTKSEIPVDEGIQDLKRKLDEERLAREQAEIRAREAQKFMESAKSEVDDTNLKLIDTAIETVKGNNAALKEKLKEALRNGDVDSAADIQEAMSMNAGKLLQLENGKVAYKSRMEETVRQVQNDPVEALASNLTPRSAAWVRANPQYARDPRLYQKMVAAHNMVVADGHKPDSDEYFAEVERVLQVSRPANNEVDEAMSEASKPTQRRQSPPAAAPVSRQPTNNSGTRPNVVRLTAAEREMASMMGMTDQEYAKNKLALIKEGKLH